MGSRNEEESDEDNYEPEDDLVGKYSEKDIKEILYP